MLMPTKECMELIEPESTGLSIVKQCELLNISRSSFYYQPKEESKENLEIMKILDEQYFLTPFFGCRKLTVLLQNKGYSINRKRTKRLMKIINWQTIYREPRTTICEPGHKKYPYLLKNLKIIRKNQVWATDITYIPMEKGFMYLSAIIDLHTRCVLNWSVSNSMSADWCVALLNETIGIYGKSEIFNTDQGSQYTSCEHVKVLTDNGIQVR